MKRLQRKEKVIAIVPAAGLGKRFGLGTNKPFQILGGKPLIIWSLETLESVDEIVDIIPVLKVEDMEHGQKVFEVNGFSKVKRIAPGGRERQDSVYNGLKLIDEKNCMVLIHDGVRPLIEKDLIEKAIRELSPPSAPHLKSSLAPLFQRSVRLATEGEGGDSKGFNGLEGVALGVPLKDTIKEAENGIIKKTLRRDSLWAIQTPQVFHYRNILEAYEKAMKEEFYSTDDAALMERYGGKIKIVMGSYRNIKITTPEDLAIAEFFLSKKG
jgi:2-C-methyl-D-erythritol 4-phosphate cytidylyltransferase